MRFLAVEKETPVLGQIFLLYLCSRANLCLSVQFFCGIDWWDIRAHFQNVQRETETAANSRRTAFSDLGLCPWIRPCVLEDISISSRRRFLHAKGPSSNQ